jgi:hypothetical protein
MTSPDEQKRRELIRQMRENARYWNDMADVFEQAEEERNRVETVDDLLSKMNIRTQDCHRNGNWR